MNCVKWNNVKWGLPVQPKINIHNLENQTWWPWTNCFAKTNFENIYTWNILKKSYLGIHMLNILKIIIELFPISDEFIWWCILTEFFDVFSLLSSVLTANTHCFVLERRKQGMPMVPSQQIQPIRKRLLHNQPIGKHLWFRCSRYSLHVYTTTALICACNVKAF